MNGLCDGMEPCGWKGETAELEGSDDFANLTFCKSLPLAFTETGTIKMGVLPLRAGLSLTRCILRNDTSRKLSWDMINADRIAVKRPQAKVEGKERPKNGK